MKIKDLIAKLSELPEDWEVVMAADAEGNDYQKLRHVSDSCVWVAATYGHGEVWDISADYRDVGCNDDEWEKLVETSRCILLSP